MKCASYLPVCYNSKDVNASESGITWLQNNNRAIQINEQPYNILFTPCKTSQYQGYEKEILRQTMLQHEIAFKEQVNELHRLYKRQRELMDEFNMRELSRNNTEGKTSKTHPVLSKKLSEKSHNPSSTMEDPSCHWPSSTFKFQAPSTVDSGNSMQVSPNTSITASGFKGPILLPSSSIRRTFDLELPADQYIEYDEEKIEEENVSIVSKALDDPRKDLSSLYHQNTSQLYIYNPQLKHAEGNSSGTGLISNLADLNKTVQLEKEAALYSTSHLRIHTCYTENPHLKHPYSQKPDTAFQVMRKEVDCMQARNDCETCSESVRLQKVSRQQDYAYSNQLDFVTKPEPFSVSSQREAVCNSRWIPVATRELPYFGVPTSLSKNATISIGNSWLNNNVCLPRNSMCDSRSPSLGSFQNILLPRLEYSTSRIGPCSSISLNLNHAGVKSAKEVDSSSVLSGGLSNLAISLEKMSAAQGNEKLQDTFGGCHWLRDNHVPDGIINNKRGTLTHMESHFSFDKSLDPGLARGLIVSTPKWSAQGEILENGVNCKCQIDLNSSLNEDGSAPVEVDMGTAAYINFEPPVSPENKESSPPRGNSEEKQLTKFAESTVPEEGCPKQDLAMVAAEALVSISSTGFNATSKPREISFTCLQWFAGIVSSAAGVRENKNVTFLSGVADSIDNELSSGGIDEYAVTRPQLKEMKLEEYCCKSTGQKKRIGPTSSPSQPKRRRTRRTKSQKEIQVDILPHITSSSRHEVLKELHIIDGNKENEGKKGSGKKNSSRRQKGKKHMSTSLSFTAEGSFLKLQTSDTKLGSLEAFLPGWGKKNKRQSSHRFPARNLALV